MLSGRVLFLVAVALLVSAAMLPQRVQAAHNASPPNEITSTRKLLQSLNLFVVPILGSVREMLQAPQQELASGVDLMQSHPVSPHCSAVQLLNLDSPGPLRRPSLQHLLQAAAGCGGHRKGGVHTGGTCAVAIAPCSHASWLPSHSHAPVGVITASRRLLLQFQREFSCQSAC